MKSIYDQNKNPYQTFSNVRQSFIRYWRNAIDAIFKNIFLLIVVIIANTFLLLLCKIMWNVYASTPVGQQFIAINYEMTRNIVGLFDRNLSILSFKLTFIAFVLCFVISTICQILHILQYFYLSKGTMGKIFFWGLPLTYITAVFIKPLLNIEQLSAIYIVALFPTLSVFIGCFDLSIKLWPELGSLINFMKRIMFGPIEINGCTPFILNRKLLSLTIIVAIAFTIWNTGVFNKKINFKLFHNRVDYHELNYENLPVMDIGFEAFRTVFEKCENFIISTEMIEDSNQDNDEDEYTPIDI